MSGPPCPANFYEARTNSLGSAGESRADDQTKCHSAARHIADGGEPRATRPGEDFYSEAENENENLDYKWRYLARLNK